ncbi:MAG: hypothetical protein ABSB91_00235 [Sedimentisphaerales bacterium]
MATALTTAFGFEINVSDQPRIAEIQFVGFPGAHGVTSMHLGTRGRPFKITGKLATTGNGFDAALANLKTWIAELELLTYSPAADYTYHGQTFSNLQFIKLDIIADGSGRQYHFTSANVFCNFVMHGHILI